MKGEQITMENKEIVNAINTLLEKVKDRKKLDRVLQFVMMIV